VVEVLGPGGEFSSDLGHAPEEFDVQELLAKPPVETLDVGVLRGLARADESQLDLVEVRPDLHDLPGELAAVVDRNGGGLPALPDGLVQGICHIGTQVSQ